MKLKLGYPNGGAIKYEYGQKKMRFRPIHRYISEMAQERDIVTMELGKANRN